MRELPDPVNAAMVGARGGASQQCWRDIRNSTHLLRLASSAGTLENPGAAELRSGWTLRLRSGQAHEGARPHVVTARIRILIGLGGPMTHGYSIEKPKTVLAVGEESPSQSSTLNLESPVTATQMPAYQAY